MRSNKEKKEGKYVRISLKKKKHKQTQYIIKEPNIYKNNEDAQTRIGIENGEKDE